jgi:hypothetical protein
MNPAVMNYLQSQQQTQDAQAPQEQAPFNPFDAGIAKAISSAQESLGMTEKQQDKSLRRSMLTFADSIAQQPKQRGFFNNFGSVARALSPALREYDQSEDQALQQNNALANQILAHRNVEENKHHQLGHQAWGRQHAENQLEEQKRYHNMSMDLHRQKLANGQRQAANMDIASQSNIELDRIAPLIRTDSAFDRVGNETKSGAAFYNDVQAIQTKTEALKAAMEDAGIDYNNPLAFKKAIRGISGVFSSFTKDPKLREVAKLYEDLTAANKRAMQTAEKALSGKSLTDFTVKYGDNEGLFPNLAKDNYDVYEKKMESLLHDAQSGYEAAELSMQTGRHVNKRNYDQVKNYYTASQIPQGQVDQEEIPQQVDQQNNDFVIMQNSSGKRFKIPANNVEKAIEDTEEPLTLVQ